MDKFASDLYFDITRKHYVYNIMPIENIPSVIAHGLMSYDNTCSISHHSIAMSEVQELRDRVILPNGIRLHKYANMYFSYWNPMLYKRKDKAAELCILAFQSSVLDIPGCVLSDRNAATSLARFYSPIQGLKELDFAIIHAQYWNDEDVYEMRRKRAIKCAEILVPDVVEPNFIAGACVSHETSQKILLDMGFDKPIYVKPEKFFL